MRLGESPESRGLAPRNLSVRCSIAQCAAHLGAQRGRPATSLRTGRPLRRRPGSRGGAVSAPAGDQSSSTSTRERRSDTENPRIAVDLARGGNAEVGILVEARLDARRDRRRRDAQLQHQNQQTGHHERANRDEREQPRPGLIPSGVGRDVLDRRAAVRREIAERNRLGQPCVELHDTTSRLPVVTVGPRARLPAGLLHVLTPRTLSVLATRPLWILAARTLRVLTEGDLNARALDRGAPTGGRRLCERQRREPHQHHRAIRTTLLFHGSVS